MSILGNMNPEDMAKYKAQAEAAVAEARRMAEDGRADMMLEKMGRSPEQRAKVVENLKSM